MNSFLLHFGLNELIAIMFLQKWTHFYYVSTEMNTLFLCFDRSELTDITFWPKWTHGYYVSTEMDSLILCFDRNELIDITFRQRKRRVFLSFFSFTELDVKQKMILVTNRSVLLIVTAVVPQTIPLTAIGITQVILIYTRCYQILKCIHYYNSYKKHLKRHIDTIMYQMISMNPH